MATKRRSQSLISNLQFSDQSLSEKVSQAGFPPDMDNIATVPADEVKVGRHMPVRITNTTAGVIYVAIGDTGLAAPTGASDGIAILGTSTFILNTGKSKFIRFDAAKAAAQYVVADDHGNTEE